MSLSIPPISDTKSLSGEENQEVPSLDSFLFEFLSDVIFRECYHNWLLKANAIDKSKLSASMQKKYSLIESSVRELGNLRSTLLT